MSKLGFHISSGNRRGLGDCLQQSTNAGNPVSVIFTVEQDIWPDLQQYSPQTVLIFRTQHNVTNDTIGDGPGSTYRSDPVTTAHDWMNEMMPMWAKNKAHYYAPLNEQDPPTLEAFKWLNDFTIECMNIAEANGYKLALYAFSAGNPKDVPHPTVGDPYTRNQAWLQLIPSLQKAKANGHILLLHEYGLSLGTLRQSTPFLALRYRHAYRLLAQYNADPPLVVSETSAGVGYAKDIGDNVWLNDLQWYDSEIMKDRAIIGCCMYQLGGDENYFQLMPQLTEYIHKTPTPPLDAQAYPAVPGPDRLANGTPVPPDVDDVAGAPVSVPTPAPTPIVPTPAPTPSPTPVTPATPTPPPAPMPAPAPAAPIASSGPLNFNVSIARVRADPNQPGQVIVTFQIEATGGSGGYQYLCDGTPLAGPLRDRPSSLKGNIVESYKVVSSDGQTVEKKFFFRPSDFPAAT